MAGIQIADLFRSRDDVRATVESILDRFEEDGIPIYVLGESLLVLRGLANFAWEMGVCAGEETAHRDLREEITKILGEGRR